MVTHSSVLAWRIPGAGEPGGLPSMGSHRIGHDWSNLAAAAVKERKLLPSHQKQKKQSQYLYRTTEDPSLAKQLLSKKDTAGSITGPNLKIYYKAIVSRRGWHRHWHKNRHIHQWNRIESSEITPTYTA